MKKTETASDVSAGLNPAITSTLSETPKDIKMQWGFVALSPHSPAVIAAGSAPIATPVATPIVDPRSVCAAASLEYAAMPARMRAPERALLTTKIWEMPTSGERAQSVAVMAASTAWHRQRLRQLGTRRPREMRREQRMRNSAERGCHGPHRGSVLGGGLVE